MRKVRKEIQELREQVVLLVAMEIKVKKVKLVLVVLLVAMDLMVTKVKKVK